MAIIIDLMKSWKQSAVGDEGWVPLPSHRHLVLLESEDIILFNISNVPPCKCYSILRNSLKLFGHSSSRIASENWDPVQEVVSSNMPPCPAESTGSHEHGVRLGWVPNHQLCVPTLICPPRSQEVGMGSRPSCWDTSASWVGYPCAGSVLGAGPGVSPMANVFG